MRGLAGLLLLAGCDSVWDLEHVEGYTFPEGLVAYFPMDELVADSLVDVAGPSDGICIADRCPQATEGRVKSAMLFDGTDDVVDAPSSPVLETGESFTVTFWVRIDREPPSLDFACAASKLYGTGNDNSWQFCVYMSSWRFYSHNGVPEIQGPDVDLTVWHDFATTWDRTSKTSTLYVDGFRYGMPVVQNIRFDSGRLMIAADSAFGTTSDWFPGALDELQVYNRVLDDAELIALARGH